MTIQVLGSSCPNCKKFYDLVCQTAADMQIGGAIEYVDDLKEVIKVGIMTTPALLINGEVALVGSHHSYEAIRNAFAGCVKANMDGTADSQSSACSCCSVS